MDKLTVIGGGLAGCEAAWQAARYGIEILLFEMRPERLTEAHKTGLLGELVCSNSLRSADIMNAPGLLKKELQMADSLIMQAAVASRVPAGSAFAVDRTRFAGFITDAVSKNPNIKVIREEARKIPDSYTIIATGPLTSRPMTEALAGLIGQEYLYFYDAIAPILDAGSIEYEKVFRASRYGKGGDDYINCPMTKEEYSAFYNALIEADKVAPRQFEDEKVFEGCMPVEVMALRGRDTLRFGPMKPVGLPDPRTGVEPYAVVQLRPENIEKSAYNIVGFQTRLKWPEQKRVFSMIPGLGNAEFMRYGSLHRNTFINSPLSLNRDLSLKPMGHVYMAGQITGVEGYIESTAMGLVAGINAARRIKGLEAVGPPETTAHGALISHITAPKKDFQPSNINFGLFPEVADVRDKKKKRGIIVERALNDWQGYIRGVRQ
ncbi:MAG: methylenetetrahydrofolate--tRNA-(uracil(54)-C(5))-methyltransferase (FADH(2)-oxidizing) TrmFO [Nitrospirota bacterium]